MKKKPLLNSNLKAYSALAGSILAAGNVAEASVVYTNVNPDVTKTATTDNVPQNYNVDLDNDGTVDFILGTQKVVQTTPIPVTATGVGIYPQAGNQVAVDNNKYALALSANATINSSLTFYDGGTTGVISLATKVLIAGNTTTGGNFLNTTNKFIGVQFTKNANTYFGWIRVDVGNFNTFTIKDFAYESTANTAILAGQGIPAGVQNSYLNDVTTIKNIDNVVKIDFENSLEGTVDVINISGTLVNSVSFRGNSSEVNLQSTPAGIYSVVINTKEGVLVKKIFVH